MKIEEIQKISKELRKDIIEMIYTKPHLKNEFIVKLI